MSHMVTIVTDARDELHTNVVNRVRVTAISSGGTRYMGSLTAVETQYFGPGNVPAKVALPFSLRLISFDGSPNLIVIGLFHITVNAKAAALVAGLLGQLDHCGRNYRAQVRQHIGAAHLFHERPCLLGGVELDPDEEQVRVIDAAEDHVPLGDLPATERIGVEPLLPGVEIALEHTDNKGHASPPSCDSAITRLRLRPYPCRRLGDKTRGPARGQRRARTRV
jgi:hypothetical protein